MARYARGKHSYGICDRSGFKVRYRDLKKEWNGLKVDKRIWEPQHEAITPVRVVMDPQALRDPRPDIDTGATSYPTAVSSTNTWFTSYGPTTQLHEILTMTFGSTT